MTIFADVSNNDLDRIVGQVSEYLTHYIDGQDAVTVTPNMVEGVLIYHNETQLCSDFCDSAGWVASLIRDAARPSDDELIAWYRTTYDDDGTDDDLVLARMRAWAEGRSLGPDIHGVPRREPELPF